MARTLSALAITNTVQENLRALSAVKVCGMGRWQLPAPDQVQSQLSAAMICYHGYTGGIKMANGSKLCNHSWTVKYYRYMQPGDIEGEAVMAEAELAHNLFIVDRKFKLPGWVQNTNGIEIFAFYPTGLHLKDGFSLDQVWDVEVVDIPLFAEAYHFDPDDNTF